ncbi:MAG: Na/Pi cotransporter family protein [Clostridia bacterium]|nr:Na/Pi cotransporter family protein [Clostridia bacterium]
MTLNDILSLIGGLGLFLFGMKLLSDGLEKAAGDRLRHLLEVVTSNRLLAVLAGVLVTALIQSSSATTVLVVGFVNTHLLSLSQAVGVIMGANIGTTVTSLMLSARLNFGSLFAGLGLVFTFFLRRKAFRHLGSVFMGLAILFAGMEGMTAAMAPLRDWEVFHTLMSGVSHPLLGVLVGAVTTALLQSSSASIGILQALAAQQLIQLHGAVYILFGQNIGTCVTALLASARTNATARRAAVVHLLFNVIGTAIFVLLAWLMPFASFIQGLAPNNLRLQVALTHVIFNVTTTLLLLPFAHLLEAAACQLVPNADESLNPKALHYYTPILLDTPAIAAHQLIHETRRMAQLTRTVFQQAISCLHHWDDAVAHSIAASEEVLDFLNLSITSALVETKAAHLTERDAARLGALFHIVNDLERIGDHSVNILESAMAGRQDVFHLSDAAAKGLEELISQTTAILQGGLGGQPVETLEASIDALTLRLRQEHAQRLESRQCSAAFSLIYLDMLTDLERIADHAHNISELTNVYGLTLQ